MRFWMRLLSSGSVTSVQSSFLDDGGGDDKDADLDGLLSLSLLLEDDEDDDDEW